MIINLIKRYNNCIEYPIQNNKLSKRITQVPTSSLNPLYLTSFKFISISLHSSMTFSTFSNDSKKDRNFSRNSKNGVPKNRLRQNIKKRSERARSNARKQACADNYAFIPSDTIVVHKHRNDFRKRRVNYNLELFSEKEQNVNQFPFKYDYTWWYELMDEDPEWFNQDICSHVHKPVEYWSTDDYDLQDDYNKPSRFAENDGWDIDDDDLEILGCEKSQLTVVYPSAETIKNLDNASVLIAIQECEHFNQRQYEKVMRSKLSAEFEKAAAELERTTWYLDPQKIKNIGYPRQLSKEEKEYYLN